VKEILCPDCGTLYLAGRDCWCVKGFNQTADNFDLKAGGVKKDDGKNRYDLIAPEYLEALATILTLGAKKYEDRNWEKGMRYGRVFSALQRHLWAWHRGENADAETGKSHLWHATCCLMFLITYEARGMAQWDDRPSVGSLAKLRFEDGLRQQTLSKKTCIKCWATLQNDVECKCPFGPDLAK